MQMVSKHSNKAVKNKKLQSDLSLFLVLSLIIIYFSGCSTTRRNNVLSFFFDGVPEPTEELTYYSGDSLNRGDSANSAGMIAPEIVPQFVYHVPVKEKQCDACHDHTTMGKLTMPQPDLCYQCHDNFSEIFRSLHGPVAGGYCTACHDPHMSAADSLLVRTGQSLCLFCHNSTQVLINEVHQDISDTECTICHNPHGGDDRFMLR